MLILTIIIILLTYTQSKYLPGLLTFVFYNLQGRPNQYQILKNIVGALNYEVL